MERQWMNALQWEETRKLSHNPNILCWQPVVLLGFLTAAKVPVLSQAARTQIRVLPPCKWKEGLVKLQATKLCVCTARGRLSRSTRGVNALGERLQGWVCGGDRGFVFC